VQRVTNLLARPGARVSRSLRVIFGPDAGMQVNLPAAGVAVGADPTCDFVLRDSAVSRRHATIVPAEGGFDVADLG
jgi:pSer/pThr/pTyr-binding forkhead associated (FHA) protein